MSIKALKLLKQSLKSYEKDDGSSNPFRDAATDLLHIADEHFRKELCKPGYEYSYLLGLKDTLNEAYGIFVEEAETNELKKMRSISLKKLPLHLNDHWLFLILAMNFLSALKRRKIMSKKRSETDLTTWTTNELKKHAVSLYGAIYQTGCYGAHDMVELMAVESELERRGYEFQESKSLSIVKA